MKVTTKTVNANKTNLVFQSILLYKVDEEKITDLFNNYNFVLFQNSSFKLFPIKPKFHIKLA